MDEEMRLIPIRQTHNKLRLLEALSKARGDNRSGFWAGTAHLSCFSSDCPAREITIRLKEHPGERVEDALGEFWLTCPICGGPIAVRGVSGDGRTESVSVDLRSQSSLQ